MEDYARRNGFTNIRHFTDDGFSGVNFNRPSFQELIKEVEAGNVATIIVKDKYPKRVCEQCGKEFYPSSTRQRFCNTDCTKAHQQAEKEKKRFAGKGEHTFRQKVCKICGKPFWPSNGQEVLCSEECKAINRRQKQLAYYHRKQSEQKAGEAI